MAERVVLSWEVAIRGALPAASSSNMLYITAASGAWDGDVGSPSGHCTARRSLADLEAGDALAGAGATLLTLHSPPGADVAALGDCARLEMPGWEGPPAQWMAEGLYGTDGWLFGVGPTDLFGEALGEVGAHALGGYTQLGGIVVVTNAVFVLDERTDEALPVDPDGVLPDGRLVAPPWFAIPSR